MSDQPSWSDDEAVEGHISDSQDEQDIIEDEDDIQLRTTCGEKEDKERILEDAPDGSDNEDALSESSSVEYDQEPFETYQERVKKLIHTRWPHVPEDDVQVERMSGGQYNRIIGVSFNDSTKDDKVLKYILRIQRFAEHPLAEDLAPLLFLASRTDINVPKLIAYDTSTNNSLESTYMIQERIPGGKLLYNYPEMSHRGRCAAARQLGHFYSQLLSVTESRIGTITASDAGMTDQWEYEVQALKPEIVRVRIDEPLNSSAGKSTLETIKNVLNYRFDQAIEQNCIYDINHTKSMIDMLQDVDDRGFLADVPITLCHMDLELYNILADPENEDEPVSAVLDWDSAIFAPAIIACKPPMWLWAWKEGEDEDEREANKVPESTENQELKKIFEDAAGPLYVRLAYGTGNRLTRQLVWFALYGMHSNEQADEADAMLKEWLEFKQVSSH